VTPAEQRQAKQAKIQPVAQPEPKQEVAVQEEQAPTMEVLPPVHQKSFDGTQLANVALVVFGMLAMALILKT